MAFRMNLSCFLAFVSFPFDTVSFRSQIEITSDTAAGTADHTVHNNQQRECQLWIVRHGERIDEVPGQGRLWKKENERQWFDPLLTERGKLQARQTAESIVKQIGVRVAEFREIYVSPLRRTLQTAEPLSEVSGLPLKVVPSLGGCTNAVKEYGLALTQDGRLLFNPSPSVREGAESILMGGWPGSRHRLTDLPLLSSIDRGKLCPNATWSSADDKGLEPYMQTCDRLCDSAEKAVASATPQRPAVAQVIVVAHRELMYDFFDHPDVKGRGFPIGTPDYASVLKLKRSSSRWEVEEMPRMMHDPNDIRAVQPSPRKRNGLFDWFRSR